MIANLTVTVFTFVLFPILGLLGQFALTPLLGTGLAAGLLFLTLVPSTVQSSISFVSISRGNIPAAIVSASASNLIGVFVTPLLVIALMSATSGVHIDGSSVLKIFAQLLLPYVLGRNEQAMVHSAVAYARMKERRQTWVVSTSVGPGATNMLTGAALATINRLPVLLLPAD